MKYKIISLFLLLVLLNSLGVVFLLWQEIQEFEPEIYNYLPPEQSFIYSEKEIAEFGFEDYVKERVIVEKDRLIENKRDFIYLDLKEMNLFLYQEGEILKTLPIQSKGKEGSWWETAPGVYFVGDKVYKHFSSISEVWMPYGVQFYGNFFFHGWPYDSAGNALPLGSSGGCIRLSTSDAAIAFEFAERGMPVLVFEEREKSFLPALQLKDQEIKIPEIKGEAFLVADLETGEILLNKEMSSEIYAGSMVYIMFALTASEVINLERRITAQSWMFQENWEGIIVPGRSYRGYDLLYPLLSHPSKEAVLTLSRFFTSDHLLAAMNTKANAIGMKNTFFADIIEGDRDNRTTLRDVAKMMRYIREYRGFIFEINKKLIGSGEREGQSIFAVQKMQGLDQERFIFIGIADSSKAESDLENILTWLSEGFNLKY